MLSAYGTVLINETRAEVNVKLESWRETIGTKNLSVMAIFDTEVQLSMM